jgi:hypothetical protein
MDRRARGTLHMHACLDQVHMLTAPEYSYDFAALGAPAIAAGWAAARALLVAHAVTSVVACLGLGLVIVHDPLRTAFCTR